ncbi:DUF2407 C-terminal domain-containing protein [Xylaria arbuscula]|nr:DUF2407 C-terminal domain-containing protein [Xylaria arbuscula]
MTTPKPKPVAASAPPPGPPLLLTIRFSASLLDLELDIPRPAATTVVSLKHLIRSRLDKAHARRRLRFIHGGKILPDTAVLSSVLRALPPPPPPPLSSTSPYAHPRSKGKSIPGRPEPLPRIYVNCSIGDELLPADLESEAKAAALPPPAPSSLLTPLATPGSTPPGTLGLHTNISTAAPGGLPTTTTTSAPPRGFDRLLTAGFTVSEVNQLRLQFRGIHASRYTPDTLPSPDTFRRMEDAWIDDNGAAMPSATSATGGGADGAGGMLGMGGGGGSGTDEFGLVALLDLLVRGVIIGFVWPLGSAGWLIREEGMSSDRWRFMVGIGIMFGVLIGFIRAISGDDK